MFAAWGFDEVPLDRCSGIILSLMDRASPHFERTRAWAIMPRSWVYPDDRRSSADAMGQRLTEVCAILWLN